jgi:hypothetical protein
MEHLWSPAGATGGNRWQMGRARKPLKQAAQLLPNLVSEFGEAKTGDEIRACADAILNDFDDVPVRSFVITLAERRIRDCLREPECAVLA